VTLSNEPNPAAAHVYITYPLPAKPVTNDNMPAAIPRSSVNQRRPRSSSASRRMNPALRPYTLAESPIISIWNPSSEKKAKKIMA